MKRSFRCFCLLFFFSVSFISLSDAKLQEHRIYRVARVIDGDSLKLDNGESIRLIGIDAPEIEDNAKLKKDLIEHHLTKSAELAMGRRAYLFTKRLVEGKKVRLEFDKDRHDNYQRALAYVYLTNGIFVNAKIIAEGYAYPYPIKPDIKYAKLLNRFYKEAKENHRGLWKKTSKTSSRFFPPKN